VLAAAAPAATASRPTITKLTVGGSASSPIFTLSGHGLAVPAPSPKASPSNQQLCPLSISGNAGFDYGTQFSLLAWDAQPSSSNDLLYSAGRYRPALDELDCIGIVVLAHTTTKIRFTFGHGYVQYYTAKPRLLRNGDVVEVVLRGAAFATVVHFH
jgi:hypothetical protein